MFGRPPSVLTTRHETRMTPRQKSRHADTAPSRRLLPRSRLRRQRCKTHMTHAHMNTYRLPRRVTLSGAAGAAASGIAARANRCIKTEIARRTVRRMRVGVICWGCGTGARRPAVGAVAAGCCSRARVCRGKVLCVCGLLCDAAAAVFEPSVGERHLLELAVPRRKRRHIPLSRCTHTQDASMCKRS
jgi:hypothetical protein